MSAECLCGAVFVHAGHLEAHANKYGHHLRCSCGSLFGRDSSLQKHGTAAQEGKHVCVERLDVRQVTKKTSAIECNLCGARASTGNSIARHLVEKHHACPTCHQIFDIAAQRLDHQKAVAHCYCAEHNKAFVTKEDHKQHNKSDGHVTGFDCVLCGRQFQSEIALSDHLGSQGHALVEHAAAALECDTRLATAALAQREEQNLSCEACSQSFRDLKALHQHKHSVKHKPFSDIKCPMSDACAKTLTSPSALLFHLESGKCTSGITRDRLNAIVYRGDRGRHITKSVHADLIEAKGGIPTPSLASSVAGLSLTGRKTGECDMVSGASDTSETVILTPPASHDSHHASSENGGVIFKPPPCDSVRTDSSGGVAIYTPQGSSHSQVTSEWSFMNTPAGSTSSPDTSEPRFSALTGRWQCGLCERSFRKHDHIMQHLTSPAHAPKIFHCPTSLLSLSDQRRATYDFKTLSGLAQHIEAGACQGGLQTLRRIVGLFEQEIRAQTGKDVKLLTSAT